MDEYIYRGLYKRIDEPTWHQWSKKVYKMKHHAKIGFPKNMKWIVEEGFWFDQSRGMCYKIQRSTGWEDVE